MPNPDASRNAAHKRYEKTSKLVEKNPDVSFNEALAQKTWNADWQPGDPTHQEVNENWDYYSKATNGGQIPVSDVPQPSPEETAQKVSGVITPREMVLRGVNQRDEDHSIPYTKIVVPDSLASKVGDMPASDDSGKVQPVMTPRSLMTGDMDSSVFAKLSPEQNIEELSPSIRKGDFEGDVKREFQEEQDQKLANARTSAENQLYSAYAASGANPYDDPLFQQNLESVKSMNTIPSSMAEIDRRFTDGNGNFEFNPLNWNVLGFTSQTITPDAARNLYDYNFDREDRIAGPQKIDRRGDVVGDDAIDDGASPSSREALFMTGDQYIKYRDKFGLPGRDVDDINPNEIYSKQDEQEQYGFIPYITSEESLNRFHDNAAPHAVSNLFNRLSNFRRENTDFDVNYDGKKINGHDLIRQGNLWWQRNADKAKNAEIITDRSKATENSVPYTYVLTDANNDKIVAKSALKKAYIDEQNRPVMQFEDGDVWTFDDMDDYRRSLGEQVAGDGEYAAYWKDIEPLVLDDGTVLRADKAEKLLSNNNYEKYADYGNFNFSRPSVEDPFQDNKGNFNLNPAENNFVPWITDVALGSVPYFFKPTAAAQGMGNAMASSTGFQPGYQNFLDGTYSMLSDEPTREEQVSATLGSLAMPVTEHLWGNIGSSMIGKPLMRAIGKNEEDISPLVRYGLGTVGEGLEEIPGNIVEEFQGGSGLSGWYADDMYRDPEGNLTTEDTGVKAYDSQGTPIKNRDTDLVSRARNYVEDIPLAFIGGATLGGTLGAPAIAQYRREYNPRKREREEFGDVLERPDFDSNLIVDLTDDERDYYNR